ncbi:hypothetical protein [Chryseobacterium vrystaatense]|nr:hypothetical protein [Chryseobacterium vrystaatense]
MLNIQKRNNYHYLTIFFILFCMQSCYAQNDKIKTFFEAEKSRNYQDCIKQSGVNAIKQINENQEVIKLMTNGCKSRGTIFDNFIDGAMTLLSSSKDKGGDFIIFNWKVYSPYIPAPTVTMFQTDKVNVVEFTYYDEENNKYDSILRRKIYEEKEEKFKSEFLYIKTNLSGEILEENLSRYSRNDYYIIKRIGGKLFFYTLINGNVKQVQQ